MTQSQDDVDDTDNDIDDDGDGDDVQSCQLDLVGGFRVTLRLLPCSVVNTLLLLLFGGL
jgi:hypothetical protein